MLSLWGVIVVVKVKWVMDHQMLQICAANEKHWNDHILRDKRHDFQFGWMSNSYSVTVQISERIVFGVKAHMLLGVKWHGYFE